MEEKKKVSFNLKPAVCGMCRLQSETDNSDAAACEAVVFCKTCNKFLCSGCLKTHRRLIAMENHQIVNRDHVIVAGDASNATGENGINADFSAFSGRGIFLDEEFLTATAIKEYENYRATVMEQLGKLSGEHLTSDSEAGGTKNSPVADDLEEELPEDKYKFTEYCGIHKEEFVKFYCEEHRQLCCVICKNDHRTCINKVKFIVEEVKQFEALTPPFRKINEQVEDFKEYDKKLQHDLKELKKSKESFLHELNNKKRDIMNWLNLMEVRAVRRLEAVFDKCKREIERKRQKAKVACEELRAEMYFLKEILRNEQFDNIYKYVKMKQAEANVNKAARKKEHRQFTNTRFGLKLNDDFAKAKRDAEQLYELEFEKKGETKFNIRLKEDRQVCNITGCAMMPAGGIVVADRNNANVKVFNSQFKLIAKLTVPDGLFDLTCIGPNTLATTSPLKSKINIIEIKPEMEVAKTIDTGTGCCWGLKHHEEIFIVNCSTKESSFIRAIDLDSNLVFQVLTQCNFYSEVSVNEDTRQLVVSVATCHVDGTDAKLIRYVDEHHVEGQYSAKVTEYNFLNHLKTKGVTLDGHQNLIVCCRDTDQIYTIAHAGNEAELLLAEADGLKRPQALCYNDTKSKLLVSSENTDYVQIFDFVT